MFHNQNNSEKYLHIDFSRIFSMPNKWTFKIKPIRELISEEMTTGVWVDPFAGYNSPANIRNDIDPESNAEYHMDALDFLKTIKSESADGVIYDPPYSVRQASECYKKHGLEKFTAKVTRWDYWRDIKREIRRIIKKGGKAICCGWSSNGVGDKTQFDMIRIRLVQHGGGHNDTIVTVEIKKS